jgi:hypothetical protein
VVAVPSALTDCTVWCAGYDMSSDLNKLMIDQTVEELDVTTFGGGGYRTRIGGLKDVEAQYEGFQTDAVGAVGPQLFPLLGTANEVFTVSPTGVETSTAYMFQAGKFQVAQLGDVGSVSPFTLSAKGTHGHGVIRGQVTKAKGNVSGTGGMGSVVNLGAVGASQYLYAAVHIFSAGTTITMDLASDDNADFSSGTTRATIGPLTTAGGTWMTRVAGPITDSYFLFNVTACTGTFSIAASVGIGS